MGPQVAMNLDVEDHLARAFAAEAQSRNAGNINLNNQRDEANRPRDSRQGQRGREGPAQGGFNGIRA